MEHTATSATYPPRPAIGSGPPPLPSQRPPLSVPQTVRAGWSALRRAPWRATLEDAHEMAVSMCMFPLDVLAALVSATRPD